MYSLNSKFLKIIPILFLIIGTGKIIYIYFETKEKEADFAKKEAEVLNSYVIENRNYYQNLFLNGTIDINQKTLSALPAYSSYHISKAFSQNNPLKITLSTVSDRARNSKNSADRDELEAINFFKANSNEDYYFNSKNPNFYQYATVLKITPVCLKCHGAKNDAPSYIQQSYENSYDYNLGEVRGIVSIKIPKKELSNYFFKGFFKSALYDLILFLLLFIAIIYLIRFSKKVNETLEKKIEQKTLEFKSSLFQDRLTKLPNRLKLIEDIELSMDKKHRHLALVNIDAFKDINDLYGYAIGDEILIQVSQRIRNFCTDLGSIYKLPNDEFAIFVTDKFDEDNFHKTIKTLLETINETKFSIDEQSIFISFSCGISSNKDPLLIKANTALQAAKSTAKSVVIYKDSLNAKEQITKNMDALLILKEAIAKNQITPYFQPIYNTRSKKIEKYEALARIVREDGSVIAPFAFLDIAIKSKLYPEITKAMILKSFEFFKDKEYEFSINLSILDIQNQEVLKFILSKLREFPEPQRVVFEILESHKIENYQEMKSFIKEVKKYGSKIAIDDFGSGYSNFSQVFELNVDCLKIDASLVKYITTDESSRVIIKTIVNFASNLGLKTIAEFVEDRESLEILEKMGIDFIQGYYIGKPSNKLCENFSV
ncbi:diguanylate cyclase/phosphodiesterase [Sulfurimonas denitrificans DSM 1251]|uniref:Diguanylate cyclase/phosphodiesterase n=1 Tax=Sulfurimonas denitrificans (strain ATCC 33889 / DSM 1251) TaxID=326298 RepID=Q30TM0_SULDN|nr:EAL domain-containing protein [Sulfurimonas denitrificans]ABB43661.1 diguanylate cyclase/phosphodiesterase [Sulfurimonas denitrificans DSM 1251]MDD3442551.1 EAL domain-containing protein [Sulfurimonas denitrificans]